MGLACNVIALQPPAEGAMMLLDPELDAATHETLRSCGGEGPYPGGNGESGWLAWCEKRSHTGWGGSKVRGGRRG
jgi:hypothetical protein